VDGGSYGESVCTWSQEASFFCADSPQAPNGWTCSNQDAPLPYPFPDNCVSVTSFNSLDGGVSVPASEIACCVTGPIASSDAGLPAASCLPEPLAGPGLCGTFSTFVGGYVATHPPDAWVCVGEPETEYVAKLPSSNCVVAEGPGPGETYCCEPAGTALMYGNCYYDSTYNFDCGPAKINLHTATLPPNAWTCDEEGDGGPLPSPYPDCVAAAQGEWCCNENEGLSR
jgi:hypothetical protein